MARENHLHADTIHASAFSKTKIVFMKCEPWNMITFTVLIYFSCLAGIGNCLSKPFSEILNCNTETKENMISNSKFNFLIQVLFGGIKLKSRLKCT